jgi:hypothetical protein
MVRIGLIGENPNDTSIVAKLLIQTLGEKVDFFPMLNDVNGDNLDTDHALRMIRREFELHRPSLIIYIRDLDALETDKEKIAARKAVFKKRYDRVEGKAILLLIVVESEALVLADIDGFLQYLLMQKLRKEPSLSLEQREVFVQANKDLLAHVEDPMHELDPKQTLIDLFGYDEGKLARIAEYLRLPVVLQNHRGFALFFKRFLKKLEQIEGKKGSRIF